MAALQNWNKTNSYSLFERIEHHDQDDYHHSTLIDSIKRNLYKILNERPDGCQSARQLGVIDLNDATMSTNELNSLICSSIQKCIEDYEPRISSAFVQARQGDDPLTLLFHVTAYIDDSRISFDVKLDHQQKYQLF